ncbi:MAG: 16S rRNA pseudouridine(516) synthase, partial [Verrucomicrobiota bacterium]
ATFETDGLSFVVFGEAWEYREKVYLALHKPEGFECSHAPEYHESTLALLPDVLCERGVKMAGRLDVDTTGLMILSDDGPFIHRITSPKHRVPKVYQAEVRHPLKDEDIESLLSGVSLHGEPKPVVAAAVEKRGERELDITIESGSYHQVRRMIAAISNRVECLHRKQIGGLKLDLEEGEWRYLDDSDLALF